MQNEVTFQQCAPDNEEPPVELRLRDKNNKTYRVALYLSDYWVFKVWDGPVEVAYCNCHLRGELLQIMDFRIEEKVRSHSFFRDSILRKILPLKPRYQTLRNQGIGTALLNLVIEKARANAFREIGGWLAPVDLKPEPWLPDWYRRRGFNVQLKEGNLEGNISMHL